MILRIGPGGTAGLGYGKGLDKIHELELNALEVEFTHGVRMSSCSSITLGDMAKERDISLSIHAPYYINLASDEEEKVVASKERILQSCLKANEMGAKYVIFHIGFYQKKTAEETYLKVKENMIDLQKSIKDNKWNVKLAPETTGKYSQFGSLDELLLLSKDTGCHICIDFAHLLARGQGELDYEEVIEKVKHFGHIHAHFSGIEWTDKGERRHLVLEEKDIVPFAKAVAKHNLDITIICESPDPINDAKKIKDVFERLI